MRKLKPTEMLKVIDKVRTMLANRLAPDHIEQVLFEQCGIAPLVKCEGEAHSNAYIDNCMQCAPRWGWIDPVDDR